jgi:raffinose/stachyose/melibiose transport system permease protein
MRRQKIGLYFLEIVTAILMVVFFAPFFIVIMNAAKANDEIIRNPLSMPSDWLNVFRNAIYSQLVSLVRWQLGYLSVRKKDIR